MFHEVNVLVVLGLTICNVVVDVMSPHNEFTVVMSFAYVVCALSIFTMDAIEIKTHSFICFGNGEFGRVELPIFKRRTNIHCGHLDFKP